MITHVTVKMQNNNLSNSRHSKTHLWAVGFTSLKVCLNLNVHFNPYQYIGFEIKFYGISKLGKTGIHH